MSILRGHNIKIYIGTQSLSCEMGFTQHRYHKEMTFIEYEKFRLNMPQWESKSRPRGQ